MKKNLNSILKAAVVIAVALAMIVPASATTVKTKTSSNSQPTQLAMLDTFTEGFEGGVLPAGWQSIDDDGDTYIWDIAASPEEPAHTGTYCMMSASYINSPGPGALNPDNWLITPPLSVTVDSDLTFWVAAQDPDWAEEHIEVWVSTTGTSVPGDFTTQIDDYTCPAGSSDYVQLTDDLSAFAGQTIYIAFRHCECTDMFEVKIDDVTVTNTGVVEDTTPPVTTCTITGENPVTITLTATDDLSGVNDTMYKIDDGTFATYTAPVVVTEVGDHVVYFYSVDYEGNIETEKNQAFTVALPITITIKGGLGVSAVIKNTGTTDLANIDWTIDLDGTLIFVGKAKSGTIAALAAGEEVVVKDFVIGFGKTGIAVTAGTEEASASGTVLLILVIGVA